MEVLDNGQLNDRGMLVKVTRCSLVFFEQCSGALLAETRKDWLEEGREVVHYHWTFRDDDRRQNVCSLVCMSKTPQLFVDVTAPDDELVEAVIWVIQHNPHIVFTDQKPYIGFTNEDFMYGRATARLNFTSTCTQK